MHEEVVDLVVEVLLLERDEVLPAEIQWFHLIFENFFGRNQPGIRVSKSPPGFAPSVGPKAS